MLQISNVLEVVRFSGECPICHKSIFNTPIFKIFTSNRDIMLFLEPNKPIAKKSYRIYKLHPECLEKIRKTIEELENEGYVPLTEEDDNDG